MSRSLHLTKKSASWRKRKFLGRRKAKLDEAKEHDELELLLPDEFDEEFYEWTFGYGYPEDD
jgi:hypothetical protein